MPSLDMKSLEFLLLPGRPTEGFTYGELHDRAYSFWRDFWSGVYRSLKIEDPLSADDFMRQDMFSLLTDGDKIVALHAYTIFDLEFRAHREHSYIARHFTESTLNLLRRKGARRVMTMEYFAVAAEWRSKQTGLSLASVVAGLGVQLAQSLNVDAIIAIARTDIGVDRIGKAYGAEAIGEVVTIHDVPSEPVAFFRDKIHDHRDDTINRLVRYFWMRRVDTTQAQPLRKVA